MELENNKARFEQQGLNVAAVMYDSPAIIKYFAARTGITYPMLSDDGAGVAEAFGILNRNIPPDSPWFGIAFPGTYIIDSEGTIRSKYFEDDHRDRFTASSILAHAFSEVPQKNVRSTLTPHLRLTSSASNAQVRGGNRVTLILEIELRPGMHVYAPDVEGGYIPVEWKIDPSQGWKDFAVVFPPSKTLYLPALDEKLPVYEGRLRLVRDLLIGLNREMKPFLDGNSLKIHGSFRYQACNDEVCFPPETLPLEWEFKVLEHDRVRAPEELRRH